jgi:hypothetical protein
MRTWPLRSPLHLAVCPRVVAGLAVHANLDVSELVLPLNHDRCAGNFVKPNIFERLDKSEPGVRFDAVSCQFAIHYSWTSEKDARTALRNAACRLKPKGLFIGTVGAHETAARKPHENFGIACL